MRTNQFCLEVLLTLITKKW